MVLMKISQHLYVVKVGENFYEGTRKEAINLLKARGVMSEEIGLALEYFMRDGHNRADFGVRKTFIFSCNDPEVMLKIPAKGVA